MPESLFFKIAVENLAQVFLCELFEISQNTFFLKNTSGGCFCLNPSARNLWKQGLILEMLETATEGVLCK